MDKRGRRTVGNCEVCKVDTVTTSFWKCPFCLEDVFFTNKDHRKKCGAVLLRRGATMGAYRKKSDVPGEKGGLADTMTLDLLISELRTM